MRQASKVMREYAYGTHHKSLFYVVAHSSAKTANCLTRAVFKHGLEKQVPKGPHTKVLTQTGCHILGLGDATAPSLLNTHRDIPV